MYQSPCFQVCQKKNWFFYRRRSFSHGCDKQCTVPPEICLRRSSCGNRVAKPSYVCFDNWFPGIERCERESDASCQVELVLVSICCGSVLAVVGLCQVQ